MHHRIVEQPFKIPFLATIILAANAEKPEVGKFAVESFGTSLQNYLELGAFTQVKLMLRLFACMGIMLEGDGIYSVLDSLRERAEAADGHAVCTS